MISRVAISSQDPGIPEHYHVREAKGLHWKELGLNSKKKRKLPMDNDAQESMQELEDNVHLSSSSHASGS